MEGPSTLVYISVRKHLPSNAIPCASIAPPCVLLCSHSSVGDVQQRRQWPSLVVRGRTIWETLAKINLAEAQRFSSCMHTFQPWLLVRSLTSLWVSILERQACAVHTYEQITLYQEGYVRAADK